MCVSFPQVKAHVSPPPRRKKGGEKKVCRSKNWVTHPPTHARAHARARKERELKVVVTRGRGGGGGEESSFFITYLVVRTTIALTLPLRERERKVDVTTFLGGGGRRNIWIFHALDNPSLFICLSLSLHLSYIARDLLKDSTFSFSVPLPPSPPS